MAAGKIDDVRVPARHERMRMTAWFDPGQLFQTGLRTLVSRLFGQNADRRVLDAIVHQDAKPCDHSREREIWIDYVSDTGDGWNPTYSVAYHVARPELSLLDPLGATHDTRRGRVLVFGGDEVYPTPSRAEYQRRLVAPFRTALAKANAPAPDVFAVPGNHDWYDSLVAFTRLFCGGARQQEIGAWRAQQTLSYFALKLPHRWWLVGIDVQLDSDIDDPQLEYFHRIAEQMEPEDRVILCTAEPDWIYEARYQSIDPTVSERNLDLLQRKVFEGRIAVYLAGDLHHYRRHEAPDGRQKITAGGGGAYLSPTHHDVDEVAELRDGFVYRAAYPEPKESKRLSWGNLVFPRYNPKFGIATGILYLLLGWSVKAPVSELGLSRWPEVLRRIGLSVLGSQVAVLWGALLFTSFVFFTDTRSKRQKWIGGSLHALANVVAALCLGWAGSYFGYSVLHLRGDAERLLVTGMFLLVGGYFAGAEIMGVYLLLSLNLAGRHNTEAFSSMHIEDYKSWLRLHVGEDGTLRIFPIKLRRVARKWRPGAGPAADGELRGLLEPDDPKATPPALIEPPITVGRRVERLA